MKRLELFEFEDQSWLPMTIRTGVTNLLVVFHRMMGTADTLALLINKARKSIDFDQVVDLGSGSGGAMIECFKKINDNADKPLQLLFTDLYPHPDVVNNINNSGIPYITYKSSPVDATEIGDVPSGLKTMIASFHHMNPKVARKILNSAEDNNEPILIYEVAKNSIPTILWWLLLPLSLAILFVMSWFMTPFTKRLSLAQILFTYIIPIIPIVYAWDGQASLMRTYTFFDINELIEQSNAKKYKWEMDDALKPNGKKVGYYLMGIPISQPKQSE